MAGWGHDPFCNDGPKEIFPALRATTYGANA